MAGECCREEKGIFGGFLDGNGIWHDLIHSETIALYCFSQLYDPHFGIPSYYNELYSVLRLLMYL
jgi:hypothetical protein